MKTKLRFFALFFAVILFIQQGLVIFAKEANNTDEQSTKITGQVSDSQPEYYVMFPGTISLGEINENKDISVSYEVKIIMSNTNGGTLRVSTPQTGYFYLNGDSSSDALKYTNTFNTRDFTDSATVTATILVAATDVAKVTKGSYSGSLVVKTTYYPKGVAVPDIDEEESTSNSTSQTTTTEEDNDDGTYLIPVSMRKHSDFSSTSMCDTLFYDYAKVVKSGTSATVTVYVIDPIPNYQSYGTPISNIKVQYGSNTVSASLSTGGSLGLYFASDSVFIPTSGYYNADPITFTVPYAYIEQSANKTLLMQAYVNAVMESTESFYMVFDVSNRKKEASLNTSTDLVDLTSIEEATDEDDEDEDETKLSDGTYTVGMGAKKSSSDEDSMMATYMYPSGQLVVAGDTATLTFYVQHTVAGKENGGPEYIKYKGVTATKVSKAATYSGIEYDSFTITLANPVPTIFPVTMYVNAMGTEVGCRLTIDLNGPSEVASTTTSSASTKKTSGASTSSSGSDSLETIDDDTTPLASGLVEEDESGNVHLTGKSVFVMVVVGIILAGVAGLAGFNLYLRHKKRNIVL